MLGFEVYYIFSTSIRVPDCLVINTPSVCSAAGCDVCKLVHVIFKQMVRNRVLLSPVARVKF